MENTTISPACDGCHRPAAAHRVPGTPLLSCPPEQGWGLIAPRTRVAHYYRETMSLCRKRGFYTSTLDPRDTTGPDDCAACRKVLAQEARAAIKGLYAALRRGPDWRSRDLPIAVSPGMARIWLDGWVPDRASQDRHVREYAARMADGTWEDAGPDDPVRITAGDLPAGKLRLAAIARSGITIPLRVAVDPALLARPAR